MLYIMHLGIASATRCDEMKLSQEESKTLADSTANVLNQFDIQPDPRVLAVIGLVQTAGLIYGPRVYFIRERLAKERSEKRKSAEPVDNIAPFMPKAG